MDLIKEGIHSRRAHALQTDRNFPIYTLHLLPPPGVRKGFIKDEALRLLRTKSSKATFEENIKQFKRTLRDRSYADNLSENTPSEIKFSERMSALQNKLTKNAQKDFAVCYRISLICA